jgi:hypothetical protein
MSINLRVLAYEEALSSGADAAKLLRDRIARKILD